MNKDLSDWINLNPKIKILYTKKKFFNEFYFRLNYFVPGARMITLPSSPEKIFDRVDRYNRSKQFYYASSNTAFKAQILDFHNFYQQTKAQNNNVKFRVEAENFSIYTNSLDKLHNIAHNDLYQWKSEVVSVSLVENSKSLSLLDQGYIVVDRARTHPYKINLKSGFDYNEQRTWLKNYIIGLGQQVKITKHILERLDGKHKYFPGGYIYVDDHRLIDIMRMIAPNIVGSVNQLVTQ